MNSKRIESSISKEIIKTDENMLLDSPAYKQMGGKYMAQNYSKYWKNSSSKSKKNIMDDMLKAYNLSINDFKPIDNTEINKIMEKIDEHMERYSAKNSSRNEIKVTQDKSLILPSLSKRPGIGVESIKSTEMKKAGNYKSMNRLRKRVNNNTKKIKITSLKTSPHSK